MRGTRTARTKRRRRSSKYARYIRERERINEMGKDNTSMKFIKTGLIGLLILVWSCIVLLVGKVCVVNG